MALSSADLTQAARAIQVLVSPFNAPSVDAWRSSVNRCLRELLNADSAGFLLPTPDGPYVYSDEHDPSALTRYPEMQPPRRSDGRSIFSWGVELGATTLEELYGEDLPLYLRSAYYNEFAGPNGAHWTLTGVISLGSDTVPEVAGIQLWQADARASRFGGRELDLLRLVFPALRAGIEIQQRLVLHRRRLLSALDELGEALLVCDASGRVLHRTSALHDALAADPEAELLWAGMLAVANELGRLVGSRGILREPSYARELQTAYASYRMRGALYRDGSVEEKAFVLVSLERTSPVVRPAAEIVERFRLSRAELRVAMLLARGDTTTEIALELVRSVHTVRRHTERIMLKSGSTSRVELVRKLLC
jgi:DNA-binding CsgD family transcriptional regulator